MRVRLLMYCFLVLAPMAAAAQRPLEPCCNITAVDLTKGTVTVRDSKSGKVFRLLVQDRSLFSQLKVGGTIGAVDFTTGKVRIHGAEPVNGLVLDPAEPVGKPAEPVGKPNTKASGDSEPCCNIQSVDPVNGIVTGKVGATGRTFRFEVKDAALLGTLKVGQRIWADFGTSKVRINGVEPCCNIIGHKE